VKQKGIVLKPGVYNVLIQEISPLSLQSRSSQRSRSENISTTMGLRNYWNIVCKYG